MRRYFVVPRVELQAYVDRFWGWESDVAIAMPSMLPGTGAELMFHYARPFAIEGGACGLMRLGAAQLSYARRIAYRLLPQGEIGFVAVRFRSGALRHFCPLPLSQLANNALSIDDVWGGCGSEVAERVAQAGSREQRVALIERWLLSCLERYRKDQPAIEAALHALYYRHRDVRIDALAERIGMSRRHFERVFREQIGITPKAFQRNARLNLTVRELLLSSGGDTLGVALDHGYYDQAHFVHDFQSLVGKTPSAFLNSAASEAHFYNPPIFAPDKVPIPR